MFERLVQMSKAALVEARNKVRELIDTLAVPNDSVGNTTRAVQEEFAEWLAENPDAAHEVRQHFIRGCVFHMRGKFVRGEQLLPNDAYAPPPSPSHGWDSDAIMTYASKQ